MSSSGDSGPSPRIKAEVTRGSSGSLDTPFDWKSLEVPEDKVGELALGRLHLHLTRTEGELRMAHYLEPRDDDPLRWSRWAPKQSWDGRVCLRPVLPGRTMVVRPEAEFWLAHGASARIYVRVPVVAQIETLETPPTVLSRIPTQIMSDTWWGDPEEGELCFYLETSARRQLKPDEFLEHLCVCAFELTNDSSDSLLVNRIALRPSYLSVYRDGDRLLGTTTRVRYRGADLESELSIGEGPPAEAENPELVTSASETMARGFSARTFARLRSSLGEWL